jgi:hypothetical protein
MYWLFPSGIIEVRIREDTHGVPWPFHSSSATGPRATPVFHSRDSRNVNVAPLLHVHCPSNFLFYFFMLRAGSYERSQGPGTIWIFRWNQVSIWSFELSWEILSTKNYSRRCGTALRALTLALTPSKPQLLTIPYQLLCKQSVSPIASSYERHVPREHLCNTAPSSYQFQITIHE